jgi:hypothetical protein
MYNVVCKRMCAIQSPCNSCHNFIHFKRLKFVFNLIVKVVMRNLHGRPEDAAYRKKRKT